MSLSDQYIGKTRGLTKIFSLSVRVNQVWYLKSKDLIDLLQRFDHLRLLEKLWHYTALQVAEAILYEYFQTLVRIVCRSSPSRKIRCFLAVVSNGTRTDSYLWTLETGFSHS